MCFSAVASLRQILQICSPWRIFLHQAARPIWVFRGCSEVRSECARARSLGWRCAALLRPGASLGAARACCSCSWICCCCSAGSCGRLTEATGGCGELAGLAQASEAAAHARWRSASAGVRRCNSSRAPAVRLYSTASSLHMHMRW